MRRAVEIVVALLVAVLGVLYIAALVTNGTPDPCITSPQHCHR